MLHFRILTMFHIPCCLMDLLQLLILLLLVGFAFLCILVKITTKPLPNILNFEQEKSFRTSKSGACLEEFPSLDSPPTLKLSVIVPAYNEELRLPKMLDECLEFLEARNSSYEVIIVDDGSKDTTTAVGLDYVDKYGSDKVRVLTLAKNRGKGGAVRMGMLKARWVEVNRFSFFVIPPVPSPNLLYAVENLQNIAKLRPSRLNYFPGFF